MRHTDICVVVAARNEAEKIGEVLQGVHQAEPNAHIIVIDDGSEDRTASVATRWADMVVSRPWRGLGASVHEGYTLAVERGFPIIVNIDGDGQHDPELLSEAVAHLRNSTPAVKFSRFHPESRVVGEVPTDRLELNRHFAERIREITGWPVTDALCGFWGFKRETLAVLLPHLRSREYGLCLEILIKMRFLLPDVVPLELAHPAIYVADCAKHVLKYAPGAEQERRQRFEDHERHIEAALSSLAIAVHAP